MTADAVGGVWTYAIELAQAHAAAGISTTLAVMGRSPTAAQREAAVSVPGLELITGDFKLEWMESAWAEVAAAGDWLLELEARTKPDVVHLNGYVHGSLPWRSPVVVVGHSCVLSWHDAIGGTFDRVWLERYHDAVADGLRAADWIVAPTAAMLDALQCHYGPLANTSVIANARDPRKFQAARKEPFVFTAGRLWDPAKNLEAVCTVAPRLSWPVVAAGDSGDRPQVRHVGTLSEYDMAEWLSRASIFALPARYEPFGLSAVEAALSGCALVLGDIPSLREVWGDAADFVDPDNREALSIVLERLIRDERLREQRALAARQRALTFDPAAMAREYSATYRRVLASRNWRRFACAS